MEKYSFWNYETEVDKEATKEWYQNADTWNCDCGHCRNFLEIAKNNMLPAEVMIILNSLEIPPEKATYVCELYEKGDKLFYQFSYRIAGNILEEKSQCEENEFGVKGGCWHEVYPYGAPNFPEPHFDLEFCVELPWVLKLSVNYE